jgi:predicted transcriptional regulator
MLILSETGQGMPTTAEFEMALVKLVHEGTMDRVKMWRAVKDYSALLHQTQMMRARYQQQKEQNYADRHAEFIAKFIEPYRVAL